MVTADGERLRGVGDADPDLFWALRGGGGNFGVVTEFEFRLHEVDPIIQLGLVVLDARPGRRGTAPRPRHRRATCLTTSTSSSVAATRRPRRSSREHLHFQPGYVMVVVGFGRPEAHARVLDASAPDVRRSFEFVTPMPYVALQQMLDEANDWGAYCYDKGGYVEDLSDGVIDALVEHMPTRCRR